MRNKTIVPVSIAVVMIISILGILTGCKGDYTPRPRGFIRIDLPEKEYQRYDTTVPYSFEYPVYAIVEKDQSVPDALMYRRLNVHFVPMKGTLHLTYEPLVKGNLDTLIGEAVDFVYKHVPKATTILKSLLLYPENQVYGTLFDIRGRGAASTYQFYLTDSTSHFMRGALYLNTATDNDSLRPVVEFLKQDIDHFIKTLQWK